MSDLKERLKRALAFDKGKRVGPPDAITNAYNMGLKDQYDRLRPLHLALVECVEALELYGSKTVSVSAIMCDGGQTARVALARVRELVAADE
jgi:hypothetical protein